MFRLAGGDGAGRSQPRHDVGGAAACEAYALATSVFVGMQPVFRQVPSKSLCSKKATALPAFVRRPVSDGPAWPAPIMIAS